MIEITLERALEIASLVINGLRDDDEESALEYLVDTVQLNKSEQEYFGIKDSLAISFLDEMVNDDTIDMQTMFVKAVMDIKFDFHTKNVYSKDGLKKILIQKIQDDEKCSDLFASVEECYDMYVYDKTQGDHKATPIQNKKELKNVLLYEEL